MWDKRDGEKMACWKLGIMKITFRYNLQNSPCKQEGLKIFTVKSI